jgi:uncharacterized membrane protein
MPALHALALASLVGIVAGLRSMTAPAVTALALRANPWSAIFVVLAVLEMIADKQPWMRSRLLRGPLLFRCLAGAACAWLLTGTAWLAAVGLAGALAGSYGGAAYRRAFRGTAPALAEDAAAVATALVIYFLHF